MARRASTSSCVDSDGAGVSEVGSGEFGGDAGFPGEAPAPASGGVSASACSASRLPEADEVGSEGSRPEWDEGVTEFGSAWKKKDSVTHGAVLMRREACRLLIPRYPRSSSKRCHHASKTCQRLPKRAIELPNRANTHKKAFPRGHRGEGARAAIGTVKEEPATQSGYTVVVSAAHPALRKAERGEISQVQPGSTSA